MNNPNGNCDLVIQSAPDDPARACPLSPGEFDGLCNWLDLSVEPILRQAAEVFDRKKGVSATLRRRPGWLTLEVLCPQGLDGKLSVSVQRIVAPPVDRLPVFWTGTVWNGPNRISVSTGRLEGLDDLSNVQNAADAFVSVFLTALPA